MLTKSFISTEKAAEMLGYSIHSIRDKARKKEIPAHRIGRKWLFDAEELVTFAVSHETIDRLII